MFQVVLQWGNPIGKGNLLNIGILFWSEWGLCFVTEKLLGLCPAYCSLFYRYITFRCTCQELHGHDGYKGQSPVAPITKLYWTTGCLCTLLAHFECYLGQAFIQRYMPLCEIILVTVGFPWLVGWWYQYLQLAAIGALPNWQIVHNVVNSYQTFQTDTHWCLLKWLSLWYKLLCI